MDQLLEQHLSVMADASAVSQRLYRWGRLIMKVFLGGHGDAGCGELVVVHRVGWGLSGNPSPRFNAVELWGYVAGKTLAVLAAEQALPKWETRKAFPSAVPLEA